MNKVDQTVTNFFITKDQKKIYTHNEWIKNIHNITVEHLKMNFKSKQHNT